jgi:hypothetical protein
VSTNPYAPLLILGERRQCIHDLLADTIVVKA